MIDDLQKLFLDVADLNKAAREKYFEDHAVSGRLRHEVESLLRFDSSDANVLTAVVGSTVEEFLDSIPERSCGPYELVRLLGRGGMGSVYLAQRKDGEVDLQVAVKLIRAPDALRFRDRFLKERQILASLKHPSITRLLDAGHTGSGQPYLVMEYVEGTPIDVYCRDLSLNAKIELFLRVCDAIAYLHRNLVIHRDLKPSNILIEAGGAPKILDFGIAKILDETGDNGVTKERMLTPDYASPEQAKGLAKTTATDVYSLGAVLYQLLTGQSPHTSGSESVEEAICTVDPIPPGRLNPSLPRDLNSVVRKALRKEPAERYLTVDAFADDLRAVLESRPVKARAGDAWYKARKFARRHWLPVSAVAAAILSLAIGLFVASRENAIAQRRFAQLRQLSNRVLSFDGDIRGLPGSTKAREKIVAVSMDYLDGLSREARNDLDLKLEVAAGYVSTAEVQGIPMVPNLGKFKEADDSLAKASALVESVLAAVPSRPGALMLGANIEEGRMIIADTVQDWKKARDHATRAVGYLNRLEKTRGFSADLIQDASRIFLHVGQALMNIHQYEDAVVEIERGIDLARQPGTSPGTLAQGLSVLANARRQKGDLDGALTAITEARARVETVSFTNETQRASTLYAILWRQGVILGEDESVSLNRPADAVEPLQKAFDIVDRMAAKDPNDVAFRDKVGTAGQQLGDILRHSDPARALAIYDRTLERTAEIKSGAPARRMEARLLAHSSYPLRSLHRQIEAQKRIDAAFEMLHALGKEESSVGVIGGAWDNTMRASADLELDAGHAAKARDILLELQSKLLELHPNPESDLRHANDMSRLYDSLAQVDARLDKKDEARSFETQKADLWRLWDRKLPNNSFVRRHLEEAKKPLP